MTIEEISKSNIAPLTRMMVKLWPECNFDEELQNCIRIIDSEKETCYLVKMGEEYVAFIQLALGFE